MSSAENRTSYLTVDEACPAHLVEVGVRRWLLLVAGIVEPEADFLEAESVPLLLICKGVNI